MIKPIGGMLLITKKQEEDKTTKSGLVISASFNDYGPKSGTIVDMGIGEVNYKGDLVSIPELKIGDIVYFPDHTGTDIEDEEGNKYLLINHKHIMAKVE
ncbi:MAG: Heat shock protein 60 family co-chaperone GroES [Bacteroidota bacterium]